MKYYSKEWIDAVKQKSTVDTIYLMRARDLDFVIENLITDCPGAVDKRVLWELKKGKIVSTKLEENPAPSAWRQTPWDPKVSFVKGTASYDTYWKFHKKELAALDSMVQGIYRVEADMMKLMPKMNAITAFTELLASVPSEF